VGTEDKDKLLCKIKNKKELAQTYLIITTLLVTLKPNKALLNTTLLNNATSPNILAAITLNIQNAALYGFIMSVILYYVFIQSTEVNSSNQWNNISYLSKTIAVLFNIIIYYCLVEPIITDLIFINDLPLALFVFIILLFTLVIFTIMNAMALEGNYLDIFEKQPVDFIFLM
jgi:hypothetical protein